MPYYKFKILNKCILIFIIITLLVNPVINANGVEETKKIQVNPDYVPDENTAIKIAIAVWIPIYGKKIKRKKPFVATLNEEGVWVVKGSLRGGKLMKGGVPYAYIRKSDGKILKIIHTK